MTCQVGLKEIWFVAVSFVQPGFASGSKVSLKLPVGAYGQNAGIAIATAAVAVNPSPLRTV